MPKETRTCVIDGVKFETYSQWTVTRCPHCIAERRGRCPSCGKVYQLEANCRTWRALCPSCKAGTATGPLQPGHVLLMCRGATAPWGRQVHAKKCKKTWMGPVWEARDKHVRDRAGEGLQLEDGTDRGTYRCGSCTMLEWWLGDVERLAEQPRADDDEPDLPRLDSMEHAKEINNERSDRYLPKLNDDGKVITRDSEGRPVGWSSNPFDGVRPTGREGQKDRGESLLSRGAQLLVNEAKKRQEEGRAGGPLLGLCRKCGKLVGVRTSANHTAGDAFYHGTCRPGPGQQRNGKRGRGRPPVVKNCERNFLWAVRAKILGESIRGIATEDGVERWHVEEGIKATLDRLPNPELANDWFRPYVEALLAAWRRASVTAAI